MTENRYTKNDLTSMTLVEINAINYETCTVGTKANITKIRNKKNREAIGEMLKGKIRSPLRAKGYVEMLELEQKRNEDAV